LWDCGDGERRDRRVSQSTATGSRLEVKGGRRADHVRAIRCARKDSKDCEDVHGDGIGCRDVYAGHHCHCHCHCSEVISAGRSTCPISPNWSRSSLRPDGMEMSTLQQTHKTKHTSATNVGETLVLFCNLVRASTAWTEYHAFIRPRSMPEGLCAADSQRRRACQSATSATLGKRGSLPSIGAHVVDFGRQRRCRSRS
jgi:hypothetical protein